MFMSVRERIMICRVVERIEKQKSYSRKLGLENKSTYHGEPVDRIEKGARSRKF